MNYICKSESSQYYECGYSCDNGLFLKLGSENFFITDGRYTLEAKEATKKTKILEAKDILSCAKDLLNKNRVKTLDFDPKEFLLFEYEILKKDLKTNLIQKPNFSQIKRSIKTDKEIEILKKAAKIGANSFKELGQSLKKDMTEQDIYFIAKSIFEGYGKREVSFNPILAINENAAKPHALPSNKRLSLGDLLLLDGGVKYKRYCSDRTRVLEFGITEKFAIRQKFSRKKRQKIYDTVLKAKEKATKLAKVGIKIQELDKCAREVIEKAGYGKYFVHSLGHGVGIDIHEFPFINGRNEDYLQENMVFTIEPGIYLPNEFGVRIEDTVVLTSKGAEVL